MKWILLIKPMKVKGGNEGRKMLLINVTLPSQFCNFPSHWSKLSWTSHASLESPPGTQSLFKLCPSEMEAAAPFSYKGNNFLTRKT